MGLNPQNPQMMLQNQLAAALASAQQSQISAPLPGINSLNPQELQVCIYILKFDLIF